MNFFKGLRQRISGFLSKRFAEANIPENQIWGDIPAFQTVTLTRHKICEMVGLNVQDTPAHKHSNTDILNSIFDLNEILMSYKYTKTAEKGLKELSEQELLETDLLHSGINALENLHTQILYQGGTIYSPDVIITNLQFTMRGEDLRDLLHAQPVLAKVRDQLITQKDERNLILVDALSKSLASIDRKTINRAYQTQLTAPDVAYH